MRGIITKVETINEEHVCSVQYLEDIESPTITDECDVLIRIEACSLSDLDVAIQEGQYTAVQTPIKNYEKMINGYEFSGVVERIGSEVSKNSRIQIGDEVMGIAPLNSNGGCAQYTVQKFFNLVQKPSNITHEEAAAIIGSSIKAFTVLFYKMRLAAGESILILEATQPDGLMALQLASLWDAQIFVAASSADNIEFLKTIANSSNIIKVIDTSNENLVDTIMNETGGFGVDYIFDTQIVSPSSVDQHQYLNDLIRCLAVHGHVVLRRFADVQLDPPDIQMLHLKNASISFFFEQSWVLANSQQGRFLHMMNDIAEKLKSQQLKVHGHTIAATFPLSQAKEAFETLKNHVSESKPGKIVITTSLKEQ